MRSVIASARDRRAALAILLLLAGDATLGSRLPLLPDDICMSRADVEVASATVPRKLSVAVPPAKAPLPGQVAVFQLTKGDGIELEVTSPRPGAVTVHGLIDPVRLDAKGRATIRTMWQHTGRFALHFHGDDGAHVEIAVFEVKPASAKS